MVFSRIRWSTQQEIHQMGYIQIWPLTESDGEQVALEDLVAKDRDPAPGSFSRSFKATLKGTCRNR